MPLIPVLEQKAIHELLLVFDLAGRFVFAISGAMLGVRRNLDIFGILVLSFAASSAGGITRDLLIGAVPPAAIRDWRYLAVALAAGLLAFFWSSLFVRLRTPILIFDAAGLALFAVAGAQKALACGLNPLMAVRHAWNLPLPRPLQSADERHERDRRQYARSHPMTARIMDAYAVQIQ